MAILTATDFSTTSHAALRMAAREADVDDDELLVAHCIEAAADDQRWSYYIERAQGHDDELISEAVERLHTVWEEAVPEEDRPTLFEYVARIGHPAETIHEIADEKDARLIVLGGTDQRAFGAYFLGGTAEEVIRSARRPVMVVPSDHEAGRIERVLAPVDFSVCSRESLEYAAQWARRRGADLSVLHAAERPSSAGDLLGWEPDQTKLDAYLDRKRAELDDMVGQLDVDGLEVESMVREGPPHSVVQSVIDEHDIDLTVLGTHGQRGWQRFFVGSTALKILRTLPGPIVTLRHDE